jgi:gentisate 1,2-dioxygenase
MNVAEHPADEARRSFYESLKPMNLAPLWEVLRNLVTAQPATPAEAALWRFADVRPFLIHAGELISAQEAERRVLILENPSMPGQSRITRTLYAGLQLILPGEIAPCHRHTPCALRFVMEGEGAFTAVEGRRAYMHRWDLILTPSWTWHDHGNETAQPMIWLDGLDIPLVTGLDAVFAEQLFGRDTYPQVAAAHMMTGYGSNLRQVRRCEASATPRPPLFNYPYSQWRESLETLRRQENWDLHDGLKMEFTNPTDGGSVMPTISAFTQLLPAAFETRPLRSTDGGIYVVVEGQGAIDIGTRRLQLSPGDVFVVPAWHVHRFSAAEDLVLFSYSDKAAQEKLGLWREQTN